MSDVADRSSFLPPALMRWALAGPAAVGAVAHSATLANGFVFDDWEAIRDNPVVQHSFDLGALLHRDFWGRIPGTPGSVGTWRPLAVITLWVDRHVGSGGPFAFHLSNLVFHAAAVLALTVALARHLRDRWTAIVAGTVFAVFAVCTEAVASIVARADTLAAGFAFLAFAALPHRGEALDARRFAGASAALCAALLCKEAAIAAPFWMILADLWLARDLPARARLQRVGFIVSIATAALIAYLALRLPTFGGLTTLQRSYNNNPLLGAPISWRVFTALRLLGFSVQLTVLPLQLAPDYSFAEILPSQSLFASGPLVGLAVLVGLLALGYAMRRRAPAVTVGVAMFLVPWFVVSNVAVVLPAIFAERLLYAPAAGIALLVAVAERTFRLRERRLLASALMVVLLAGNTARTVLRDLDWHDLLSLSSQAVLDTPRCARAWNNLGAARMEAHQPVRALRALGRALDIAPDWAAPYALMGGVLDEIGQPERAETAMRRALELDATNAAAYFNLTVFLARHGRLTEALATARRGLVARPDDARLRDIAQRLAADPRARAERRRYPIDSRATRAA